MPSVRLVSDAESEVVSAVTTSMTFSWTVFSYMAVGAVLLAAIGTWLVWFSASVQHTFKEQEIRSACQRVMPETAERCFDTVVIQRGGVRR